MNLHTFVVMKKMFTYLVIVILMAGTVGITQRIHYCSGEWVETSIGGLSHSNEKGHNMPGCMDEHSMCSHCQTFYHLYRIASPLMRGEQVQAKPSVSSSYSFYVESVVPNQIQLPPTLCRNHVFGLYHSSYHSLKIQDSRGMRAPPVVANAPFSIVQIRRNIESVHETTDS